jgi:hypothetical protein
MPESEPVTIATRLETPAAKPPASGLKNIGTTDA